ncbi:Mitochondrial sodium/calcium exchanger protein [Triplophysa tibetana]|uniref:Mitochondrial sodium/calcium exchanger protein n=1 Tax=Triplophysa tibetana TaxID=1572043 RepID=A0A5A9PRT1_9TELE|nr:Mitochondrial sodium/calcium exchanger protein [Triplophysa tibetana]
MGQIPISPSKSLSVEKVSHEVVEAGLPRALRSPYSAAFPSQGLLESEGILCWVLCGALGISLVFSFILVPLQCFHLSRVYGIFLLVFYVVFLIVALLTEFKMIHF